MEESYFKPKYLLPGTIIFFSIIIIIIALVHGWCTGDTTTTKNVAIATGFTTMADCRATNVNPLPGTCVGNGIVTTDFNTWVAAVTCNTHAGCTACTKISTATSTGPVCVASGATFDINCPMTYEVDCDC